MSAAVVYRFFDKDHRLLYVGCSSDFITRMAAHGLDKFWFDEVAHVTVAHFNDTTTAFEMESVAIATEHPKYNTQSAIERHSKRLESRARVEAAHAAGERCERQRCWHCNTQKAIRLTGGVDAFISLLAKGDGWTVRSILQDRGMGEVTGGDIHRWRERYARKIEELRELAA